MGKLYRSLRAFLPLLLLLSLASAPAGPHSVSPAKAHPLLLQIAGDHPDQKVAVIVQKSDTSDLAEMRVKAFGGKITKDLHIINSFVAELSAEEAINLAHSTGVRWVSLDVPVENTGKPTSTATYTVRDDFTDVSFYNNDGSAGWHTEWLEDDVAGAGPSQGNVYIYAGELYLKDQPDTGTQPSVTRAVDLSDGIKSATLSFAYRVGPGVDIGEDLLVLEISMDGGLTFTTVTTFLHNGNTSGTYFMDLLPYASSDTRIRFQVSQAYGGPEEYFAINYVQVQYEGNAFPSNTFIQTLKVDSVWNMGLDGSGIGVAVIDSGITKEKDLGQSVKLQSSFNPNSLTVLDRYGHGTHVAGIIAMNGSVSGGIYYGIAPGVNLYSLKVSDDTGMAYESDVVEAIQWVYDNKAANNIRVVNLSINSSVESSYHTSPLSAAVEILWFNGVVVIASAGNYWDGTGFNPILAAPANDPFIITVGATDEKGTSRSRDDVIANFSAFGTTFDGHFKPDIYAPGKNIISILASHSDWDLVDPDRVVGDKYYRLSGTSMSAPMVTGAVALLLQDEPNLTPDQVKYRLINTAAWIGPCKYLDVYAAVTGNTTNSANTGLTASQMLWSGNEPITWGSVAWNSVAWNSVAWNSVAWNSVAWNSVAWNSVYWGP